jgi:uncharacterized protein YbjT (DUF2867 family)
MIAVIIGSTGLVGSEVLSLLLKDSSIKKVISFSRRSVGIENSKLNEVIAPLRDLSAHANRLKGDLYFCCLGTTIKSAKTKDNFKKVDQDAVLEFAKIARTNSAKCFTVVSAQGADENSRFFYNQIKGEVEESLKRYEFKNLIIFKPSLLIGDRKERRPMESMLIKTFRFLGPLLSENLARQAGTDIKVLAQRMLELAKMDTQGLIIVEAKSI